MVWWVVSGWLGCSVVTGCGWVVAHRVVVRRAVGTDEG